MASITTFKQLLVWQKVHEFLLEIYQMTNKLSKEEQYGLISQMRRAAVSVAANIVQGFREEH